ncbi:glutamyl-tRNA amidotransferase subunit A [Polychaeton citri CBS 116435]|uniref:Glutamyl-tRNA(Gln) amidotransferase subunit A, mitochondrial n=1 Tax=Polychaeton citri CBS 116435 TaxID=1314669 RepID=A0A9P4UNB1_9PEZI|nr:glutamyl-tRNA amidotransferase subunit A [Polychaeton citri CBS 116435]
MRFVQTVSRGAVRSLYQLRKHATWSRTSLNALNSSIDETNYQPSNNGQGPYAASEGRALNGARVAIKDNIVTAKESRLPSTASSAILFQHASPFEATVVSILRQHGAVIDGKTNLDEFGMGSHSQKSHFGPVKNLYLRNGQPLSAGGSSGGSAVAVASGHYDLALGTDTGGSVRLPAAYTGVVGFKPSYGLLSRWGVIQYANSLDTVGILANTVKNVTKIFGILNQFDTRDPTSLSQNTRSRLGRNDERISSLRIGVPTEYNIDEMSPIVRDCYRDTLKRLQSAGHTIVPVSLPSVQQALSAYYILAPAEASSNLAKFDGIRYGTRSSGSDSSPKESLPLYARTRGDGFGEEVKRRILLGAYTLSSEAVDNYFIQAQKVRRIVQRDFDKVFDQQNPLHDTDTTDNDKQGVDVLLTPTAPTEPPTLREVHQQTPVQSYMNDVFTVPASLAGLPAISVPINVTKALQNTDALTEGANVGMQIIGQFGSDHTVLDAAQLLAEMQA